MNQQFAAATDLMRAGKPDKAAALLLPLLRRAPAHAPLRYLLGVALGKSGDHDGAIYHLSEASRLEPRNPTILLDLGRARASKGDRKGAREAFEGVLGLDPAHKSAPVELSNLCLADDDLEGAIGALARGVEAHADLTDAWKALSALELASGDAARSAARLREAMARIPDRPEIDTYLCATLNYIPDVTPEEVFQVHRDFGLKTMAHIRTGPPPFRCTFDPTRPLTIGWLSPDLRRHSVAYFLEPLLEALDPAQFRHVLFSTGAARDEVTARLAAHGEFVPCRDVEFKLLPDLIRSRGVDILIELSGHTADHRLWSLARKPAPIIVSYLGYPNTTGLPTIDYRVVDELTDPPGAESLATETLARIGPPFVCYRPPENAPAVATPPCTASGVPTFGSFNAITKLNQPLAASWARAIRDIPGSRLLLKGDFRLSAVRARTIAWFAAAGLSPERVTLRAPTATAADHLGQYADVDIALDTFPYNGTTTTCEALYMGVPVLTMPGRTHASRVGLSLLTSAGLPEFICSTESDLAARAGALAADPSALARLRAGLRERLLASRLCDQAAIGASFGAELRTMWVRRCAKDQEQTHA